MKSPRNHQPFSFIAALAVAMALNTLLVVVPASLIAGRNLLFQFNVVGFLLLTNLFLATEAVATNRWGDERTRVIERVDITARRFALVTGIALMFLFALAMIDHHLVPSFSFIGGMLLFISGTLLRIAAVRQLAKSFRSDVSITAEQTLIRDGLYRYLRHPSETGLLLIGLASAVLLGSALAFTVWAVVLVPLVLIRIHLEEQSLRSAFGETYHQYAQASASLIPGIF